MCDKMQRRQEAREAGDWLAGACVLVCLLLLGAAVLYHWAYDRGAGDTWLLARERCLGGWGEE